MREADGPADCPIQPIPFPMQVAIGGLRAQASPSPGPPSDGGTGQGPGTYITSPIRMERGELAAHFTFMSNPFIHTFIQAPNPHSLSNQTRQDVDLSLSFLLTHSLDALLVHSFTFI